MKRALVLLLSLLLLSLLATTGRCQDSDAAISPDTGQQPPADAPGGAGAAGSAAGSSRPPKELGSDPTAPVVPSPPPSPSTAPVVTTPSPSPQASPKPTTPTATGTAPQPGAVVPGTPTPPGGAAAAGTAPGSIAPTAGAGAAAPGATPGSTAVTPTGPGAAAATPPPVTPAVTPVTTPVPGTVPGAVPGAAAATAGGTLPVVAPVTPPVAGAAGAAGAVQPVVGTLDPAAAATPPGSIPLGHGGVPLGVYVPLLPAAANASTNASTADNSTAIEGLSPDDSSSKLVNALLGALGASKTKGAAAPYGSSNSNNNPITALDDGSNRTGSSSSRRRRRRSRRKRSSSSRPSSLPGSALAGSSSSGGTVSFQDLRSSEKLSDGLLTTADGSAFCVASKDMFATKPEANPAVAAGGGGKLSFASTGLSAAAAVEVHDPACDDPAVDRSKYCKSKSNGGATAPKALSFMEDAGSTAAVAPVGPDGLLADGTLPATNNVSALACTQGFTKMGSAPRSLAVVLLKWARQYYKTKEECCKEASNPGPDCDCKWNGYTYDNLPPPSAYSRMFTDECDGKPSINRAYYDMSGGMVTFHGKARVPTPATVMAELSKRNGQFVRQEPLVPLNALPATVTDSSYQDPDGVDVYGWAVLPSMREGGEGSCMDWCGEAIKQMGVNSSEYNHVMCMALYSQSSTICDACDSTKTACAGTCPASSGISTGCGCGTCSFAWGGQSSCNRPAEPGVRTGLNVPTTTYDDREPPLVAGMRPRPFIKMARGNKVYMSHELGHNMGLTHTGALRCATTGNVVNRQPEGCTPDWYGDQTSFMGSGSDLQMPNAMKYRVRWLPRGTLKTHLPGSDVRYSLSAATSRRPSWQDGSTAEVRWFDAATDTLAVRVPLTFPSKEVAGVGGFKCPCPACPQCTAEACRASGAATSCCTDPSCADNNFSYYYVELHQPYANDNTPDFKGIAVRLMGDLSTCTSTRAVATHLDGEGKPQYLLNSPDPSGAAVGSKFEDPLRRLTVILEEWSGSQATIRVIA